MVRKSSWQRLSPSLPFLLWHFLSILHLGGEKRFEGLQRVFAAVHQRTSERQLSRIEYLAEKPAD